MEDICKLRRTKNKQIKFYVKQLMKLNARALDFAQSLKDSSFSN